MDEYHLTQSGERQVRLTRKVFAVKAEAITKLMYEAPYCQFGLSVFAADCFCLRRVSKLICLPNFFDERGEHRSVGILFLPPDLRRVPIGGGPFLVQLLCTAITGRT
jgi:hypothetical protein